jgi:hypothetical protein
MPELTPEEQQQYDYLKGLESQAISVAIDYHQGGCDFATFQRVLARLILQAAGNPNADEDQVAYQISEMNTATAFISAGPPAERQYEEGNVVS